MWLAICLKFQIFYLAFCLFVFVLLFYRPPSLSQFALIEKYAVDEKTGLVYHAYDESREQKWADKKTGRSPSFWARAIGWYAIALVDVLDYLPQEHPGRAQLIGYLQRLAPVLAKYQDPQSGAWYQVIDQGERWTFRFQHWGDTVGEATESRSELEGDGWRIEVPPSIGDRLEELGRPPST